MRMMMVMVVMLMVMMVAKQSEVSARRMGHNIERCPSIRALMMMMVVVMMMVVMLVVMVMMIMLMLMIMFGLWRTSETVLGTIRLDRLRSSMCMVLN